MSNEQTSNVGVPCPFCAELIASDATRCHWCRNSVEGLSPTHGGICPACKESIKKDALLCRHCGERFMSPAGFTPYVRTSGDCGCSDATPSRMLSGDYGGPIVKQDPSSAAASAPDRKSSSIKVPLAKVLAARRLGGTTVGGGGGLGLTCDWEIAWEPCTLCFPFTNWCWEDSCLVIRFRCHGD